MITFKAAADRRSGVRSRAGSWASTHAELKPTARSAQPPRTLTPRPEFHFDLASRFILHRDLHPVFVPEGLRILAAVRFAGVAREGAHILHHTFHERCLTVLCSIGPKQNPKPLH